MTTDEKIESVKKAEKFVAKVFELAEKDDLTEFEFCFVACTLALSSQKTCPKSYAMAQELCDVKLKARGLHEAQ